MKDIFNGHSFSIPTIANFRDGKLTLNMKETKFISKNGRANERKKEKKWKKERNNQTNTSYESRRERPTSSLPQQIQIKNSNLHMHKPHDHSLDFDHMHNLGSNFPSKWSLASLLQGSKAEEDGVHLTRAAKNADLQLEHGHSSSNELMLSCQRKYPNTHFILSSTPTTI